jgi:hypothetical protein
MNKEQLEEQIFHYTGKRINTNKKDVENINIFINNLEKENNKNIDKYIDYVRYELYLYYQLNYNITNIIQDGNIK